MWSAPIARLRYACPVCVAQEIFGPVLCVQGFDTEADAVHLANDSAYGLGHAVLCSTAGELSVA